MNRLNSKRNRKRGFTVVELVVALAVILIVSATAIGLINTQNTIYLRTMQTTEATNMAENAIECFRYSVNNPKDGDVNAAFEEAFGKTFEAEAKPDSLYNFETNGITVEITITVTEIENKTENKIEIYAHDGDKEILSKSYIYTK